MPEARISNSSKSARYTIRELIKANQMDNTDEREKMECTRQNSEYVHRSYSDSQNSESNDSISSDDESKLSCNPSSLSSSVMRIDYRNESMQKSNASITGSAGNVFH